MNSAANYSDELIRALGWREHIRERPGMYIGNPGGGYSADDGIYTLIRVVLDEMLHSCRPGRRIDVTVGGDRVSVRSYGPGIPLDSLAEMALNENPVGLNAIAIRVVNALSIDFFVRSVRDGVKRGVRFYEGVEVNNSTEEGVDEENSTAISFVADRMILGRYAYDPGIVEAMIRDCVNLDPGLAIRFNGRNFESRNGLLDLLGDRMTGEPLYLPIHLKGDGIEVAITHGPEDEENFFSFVNGQQTLLGGTHQTAFRQALAETIGECCGGDSAAPRVLDSVVAAISVRVAEPVYQPATRTRLSSTEMIPGVEVEVFIADFVKKELGGFLRKNIEIVEIIRRMARS